MRVEHPRAGDGPGVPPAAVDVNGEHVPVADDGTFAVDDEAWLQRFAASHGSDAGALKTGDNAGTETCQEVKGDGETCGRELPCPYHSDDEETED